MKVGKEDEYYMKLAIELAKKGTGWVNPNPCVGAVIVKNHQIIGTGYHKEFGGLHAEREALNSCVESPIGATLYVTLEPCCHYGKTSPCTEAILQSGIKKVVVGSIDPNEKIAGKGIEQLKANGVCVITDVRKEECEALNQVFFHYIQTQTPYVVMKYAMTLDGKIATYTGESKWITEEEARRQVQNDRHRYSAIMVGIGTVLKDDPQLTCRLPNTKQPIRIICDTKLKIPITSQIVQTANTIQTWIATCVNEKEKEEELRALGCHIIKFPEENKKVPLQLLMKRLGEKEIDSVLLEGGSRLNWDALSEGIVNKIQCYIAPKIFGGETSKTPVGGIGIENPMEAIKVNHITYRNIGEDILLEAEVKSCLQG